MLRRTATLAMPLRGLSSGSAGFVINRQLMLQRRMMSSSGSSSDGRKDSPLVLVKKFLPQIGVGAAVVVVTYGIAKSFYSVTTGILSLDMYDVFRYGFVTGALCVGAVGGGAFWLRRVTRISPEKAFKKALARVQSNPAAQKALGSPTLKSGQLRAYTLQAGHVSFGKKMAWVEPRAQLLFQVVGEVSGKEGMVTAEAVQHKNGIVLNLLALDVLGSQGSPAQLLLLKGSEDKLHVRGTLRGFLQTERAAFIQQDQEEDDDKKVEEQETLPTEEEEERQAQAAATAAASANSSPSGGQMR